MMPTSKKEGKKVNDADELRKTGCYVPKTFSYNNYTIINSAHSNWQGPEGIQKCGRY